MTLPCILGGVLLSLLDRALFRRISAFSRALALLAYQRGDQAGGRRLIGIAARAGAGSADLQDRAAAIASAGGDHPTAAPVQDASATLAPDNVDYLGRAAVAHWQAGDPARALERCEQALARIPAGHSSPALMHLLAQLRLPGPPYLEVMKAIFAHLAPRTYLEIGVEHGHSIVLVPAGTRALGVDPEPKIQHDLPPETSIYAERSDDFFRRDVRALLGGLPIDLAFIDGMHWFEYALRDFVQVEKLCTPGSTVLIHDCYPLDRVSAERTRTTQFWSGDVWRLVLALKKYRPDLRVDIIGTAPTGLCVVRRLDPQSRVLEERYDAIVAEFTALDYSVLEADKAGMLNFVPNDGPRVAALFA